MNIKEHIEAGHYPTDSKGRALVPTRSGQPVTILATDMGSIVGWSGEVGAEEWERDGSYNSIRESQHDLMPPAALKVTVKAYAIVDKSGAILRLREDAPAGVATGIEGLVVLTGDFEVTR